MYKYRNAKFNKTLIDISPGEFLATDEDVIISTVLGSCVSVSIHDPARRMSGLNHFMLVEGRSMETLGDMLRFERYGSYAMESLLNEFIRSGSLKKNLQAKVFGGSRILKAKEGSSMDIGAQNVAYALKFLENEEIPVLAEDTGGERPRRLYLFPRTFKILMKKDKKDEVKLAPEDTIVTKEENMIVLFDPELPLG